METALPTPQVVQPQSSLSWRGKEIPSLYGIRGIAAMAVVLQHFGVSAVNGTYAVICFFVLSGFLITHLLLKEFDKTGDVSLRGFYARRALRIMPAFYCYAAFYVVSRILTHYPLDWLFILTRITYTSNLILPFVHGPRIPTMGQTWSLAIEEQFYLLWPFVFWMLAGKRKTLIRGLIAVVLVVWVYRFMAAHLNFNDDYIYTAFETRADGLAIGCLIAVANRENKIPRWLVEWKWIGAVALVAMCVSSAISLNQARYAAALVAVACAILIIQSVAHSETSWYRWLELRPMRALGVISYSLYLYHTFASHLPTAFRKIPFEVAFAILLATGSYLFIERPFLRMKDRLTPTRG